MTDTNKNLFTLFFVKSTTSLTDANYFLKNRKTDSFSTCYRVQLLKKENVPDSSNLSNKLVTPISTTLDQLVKKELASYQTIQSEGEKSMMQELENLAAKKTTVNVASAPQSTTGNKQEQEQKQEVLLFSDFDKTLQNLKQQQKQSEFNQTVAANNMARKITSFLDTNSPVVPLDGSTEPESMIGKASFNSFVQSTHKRYVVNGLRNLLTPNMVLQKTEYTIYSVNPTLLTNGKIKEAALNPISKKTLRPQSNEVIGGSNLKHYAFNGLLDLRIVLEKSEGLDQVEKRISIPSPGLTQEQVNKFPNTFELADINIEYDPKDYAFLINPIELEIPEGLLKITPYFAFDEAYYPGTQIFLEKIKAKPSTKVTVSKSVSVPGSVNKISAEKKKLTSQLRDESPEFEGEESE